MSTLASLGNLGSMQMVILLLIVLLLFGAKKLPELARGLGQAIREFTKAKDEFENEITRPAPTVAVQEPKHTLPHTSTGSSLVESQNPSAAAEKEQVGAATHRPS